jgi:hypothetical protein
MADRPFWTWLAVMCAAEAVFIFVAVYLVIVGP